MNCDDCGSSVDVEPFGKRRLCAQCRSDYLLSDDEVSAE